ncbi:MAG: hypothetical protein KatS3mg019_0689 [Fimbriimonadales bacterium]|nr:MAG: hypothetical protein KatS3mg019_0689 [Fimbriimonadales bacterium]
MVVLLGQLWVAAAQHPTVFFGARFNLQVRAEENTSTLRWYDDLGRHSVVFLQLYHEAGYEAYVAQRLQNPKPDRDRTALDEAYIGRLAGWRVGKFYAPFGAGLLLNESVTAIQSPAQFAIGDLPMRVAYLYNGADRHQGVYVRVGTATGGVSVGIGRRFGITPHAFTIWELPERARPNQGYDTLYGADYTLRFGGVQTQLEWLYSEGKRIDATHWLAARIQARALPFQPELTVAYQTHTEQLSWRIALQQRAGDRTQLNFTLRGKAGTIQFVAFGLQGDL